MKQPCRLVLACAAFLALNAGSARADLTISVEATAINPGSVGYVNVNIESDNPISEALGQFQYEFSIHRLSGTGRLGFAAFDSTYADDLAAGTFGSYLFQGQGAPFGTSSETTLPADTFDGGDTLPFGAADVVLTSRVLLTRLILIPGGPGSLTPELGSTFGIDLVPISGQGSPGDITFFADSSDQTHSFTSHSGLVSIRAVPEPSSLLILAIGCGIGPIRRWFLRRDQN